VQQRRYLGLTWFNRWGIVILLKFKFLE